MPGRVPAAGARHPCQGRQGLSSTQPQRVCHVREGELPPREEQSQEPQARRRHENAQPEVCRAQDSKAIARGCS